MDTAEAISFASSLENVLAPLNQCDISSSGGLVVFSVDPPCSSHEGLDRCKGCYQVCRGM